MMSIFNQSFVIKRNSLITIAASAIGFVVLIADPVAAEEYVLHNFKRQQLTDVYYSEGASAGDINGDGKMDLVHGPYWFAGPTFAEKKEIYPALAQPRKGYANNFFQWIYDFDNDGHQDILTVGLPGSPAMLYHNPGVDGLDKPWPKAAVINDIGNESPQFLDINGDDRPELICNHGGHFGYASPDWEKPLSAWTFHSISEKDGFSRFTHGLGVGDINGDKRLDILFRGGWFEQPENTKENPAWQLHAAKFAAGGADMFAYDVDGDGDNDVITSLSAHNYGLAWHEQLQDGGKIIFRQHLIMGDHPSQNRYGLVFTEPHAVNLADIDGDGLKDIITGKTYWSHHAQSPMWDAGAVVYWFKLERTKEGINWVPQLADDESGIGRQLTVADVNGDKLLDFVVGGMKGAHVLLHTTETVDLETWKASQPKKYIGPKIGAVEGVQTLRGPLSPIDKNTKKVAGALEAEGLKFTTTGGTARSQPMAEFSGDSWSGVDHLWWTAARPGDKLHLDVPTEKPGKYQLEIVLTCAKDYGIVQLSLNNKPLGKPIDLYEIDVVTTGVLTFPTEELKAGVNTVTVEILGANPVAIKNYMAGIDYLRLISVDDTAQLHGVLPQNAAGESINTDFELGTLKDWGAVGKAFTEQPIKGDTVFLRRTDMHSNHQGNYWIGGFEKVADEPQGTLTSTPFKVTHRWATFLSNGGSHAETRVELIHKPSGEVIYRSTGTNTEKMRQVAVDLKDVQGAEIMIRLVDEHSGGWGHLNFDNFRFHQNQPARMGPPRTILVADDYPHSGLTAKEAVAVMKMPTGFTATVCVSEPDVKQPIAMALDDRGRVWIAEAYEYPQRAAEGKGQDQILVFEDSNGDGTFDKRTVFATGLNLVSGLEVGFGGVWVGAAPYLLFIPDRDGDDVPDSEPQVLLDGWGYQDTHETLNAFTWGPDGWLYGCHGVFTHSNVGKPGTPNDQRTKLNAGIWRYHPVRHEFDIFAHGTSNPWGVDFNDHGQAFCTACVIPHLYHVIQGARYQRQAGPHFNAFTYDDIKTIADHRHYLGATPHSGNNRSDEAGGGHAHAGAMIYLGGAWPQEYRGQIFMNNIHGQRINMDTLQQNGSGYVGSHGPDFLLTGDRASQILNMRYGPDGQVYFIDWYDMQACHHRTADIHDRSNGRLYKVTYGPSVKTKVDLQTFSNSDLITMLLNDNDWYVRHARRILQERAAVEPLTDSELKQLIEIATTHKDDTRKLRAMWALHATRGISNETTMTLLADDSEYVRGWAIQLALENNDQPTALFLSTVTKLAATDSSPVVRLYIASTLQKINLEQRWDILTALVAHTADSEDHNLPLMYWYAAEPLASVDPERALTFGLSAGKTIPLVRDYMLRRIASSTGPESLAVLINGLSQVIDVNLQLTFLTSIRAALQGQRQVAAPAGWDQAFQPLSKHKDMRVRVQAIGLSVTFGDESARQAFRNMATADQIELGLRRTALLSLIGAKDPQLAPLLQSLIPIAGLRDVVLNGLAQYDHQATAPIILKAYQSFSTADKRLALATLCSRPTYAIALLNAMDQKQFSGKDLTADLVRQLSNLQNEEIDKLLNSNWGTVRSTATDKLKLIATYKQWFSEKIHDAPDLTLGRAIFAQTCQRCHQLYGVGNNVGPDLTGSNRTNLDYLLSNVVDPSAVMAKEYLPSVIITDNGRVLTGIVREETAKAITLQTADATVIIPINEIDERMLGKQSMMPDDQLKQFSKHQIRSLLGYLTAKKQVAMLATPATAAMLFNGKDFSGWSGNKDLWKVENGEIVGTSPGIKNNEFLVSDMIVGDFELTVQVKLMPNNGNSGIQFRSSVKKDGHAVGYQADIGEGWWGKLYEELGRALLWDKPSDQHVKVGQWNEYRIVAIGDQIKTYVNGNLCVDLDDPDGASEGILAFQIHSGGPMEVRFKDIKLVVPTKEK